MCYDLNQNKTLFDRDIMEGVYCMVYGQYSSYPEPICICGGSYNIIGIDINGEDKFWTVLGGNAICLKLNDINNDGANELIVGTDDYTIRFYQNEDNINEINENTKIIEVEYIDNTVLAYALENGTIGCYKGNDRLWRKKEKGYVTSILVIDFNRDNYYEILCGWSTGKLQMLETSQGRILIETDLNKPIAKMFYDNILLGSSNNIYNKYNQLLVLTNNGEVYGFDYSLNERIIKNKFIAKDKKVLQKDLNKYESSLQEKTELIKKLEDLAIKESNKSKINSPKDEIVLPKNTTVNIDLQSNNDFKCADLIIESSENTVIKMVIIQSEQIYKGETMVKYPNKETNKVIIQIKTKKDMNINLHIKALVGKSYFLDDYQVFEFNKIIPKYCFYILLRDDISYKNDVVQGISFRFNERIERLILWLETFFNIPKKELETYRPNENTYNIRFMSLRTDKILQISVKNEKENIIEISTEEMELCGNIFQDMCTYFNITDLDTNINYKKIVNKYSENINRISELDQTRNQYNINMTEIIQLIKDLFVKAEDNRLLDNIKDFKDYFRKINVKNLELLDEYEKRTKAYEQLISDLKVVNEIIQIFSNLKAGKYKNEVVNQCRNCIRKKNYNLLLKILSTGNA
jgi:Bardet-Biedl syndrome 2 protein